MLKLIRALTIELPLDCMFATFEFIVLNMFDVLGALDAFVTCSHSAVHAFVACVSEPLEKFVFNVLVFDMVKLFPFNVFVLILLRTFALGVFGESPHCPVCAFEVHAPRTFKVISFDAFDAFALEMHGSFMLNVLATFIFKSVEVSLHFILSSLAIALLDILS